jgi:hypothetical protein
VHTKHLSVFLSFSLFRFYRMLENIISSFPLFQKIFVIGEPEHEFSLMNDPRTRHIHVTQLVRVEVERRIATAVLTTSHQLLSCGV